MKLPLLLRALHPDEYKDFEKFLQSPFFKASEQYLKYFRCLCKYHPSFEVEKAELQAVYKRCFGPDSLNDTKLYNLMSGLGKQIEQFLVVQLILHNSEQEAPLFQPLLVRSLDERNTGAYFRKEAQTLIDEITASPRKGANHYLSLSLLNHEVYFNPDTPKSEDHPPYLRQASEQLDLYYYISKLRYSAEMKGREQLYSYSYEWPLLEAILDESSKHLGKHPLLDLYHALVRLYWEGPNGQGFNSLTSEFTQKFYILSKPDQDALLRHLINIGIPLVSKGSPIESELLKLYKLSIESDGLLAGNRITYSSFLNIYNLACLCNETAWAEHFLEQFAPYLEESKQQPTIHLARAGLFYQQGLLDKAQLQLIPEIFQTPLLDLLGRAILIRIAYDRFILDPEQYNFLLAQITSYEKYVANQALSTEKRKAELNWTKFVRKLTSVKSAGKKVSESKKVELLMTAESMQPLVYRKWVKDRIKAL
ncbi:MAG: hypothetical protein ACKVT2_10100 [Saprospiraceae bacterium]